MPDQRIVQHPLCPIFPLFVDTYLGSGCRVILPIPSLKAALFIDIRVFVRDTMASKWLVVRVLDTAQ